MTRFWTVLCAFVLLLCGVSFAVPAMARDTLVLGLQLEPPGLDPTVNPAEAISEVAYPNVYQGLVRFAPDGAVLPFLAESWTISPDGRIYTFHLRRRVRFHNGATFDAQTAKFSLDRARAAASLDPQKPFLADVTSIDAVDAYTLRIGLSEPDSLLLAHLGWSAMAMVEPLSAAHNATDPVGTGPFRFARWQRGESVTLVRNDSYWGPKPPLKEAIFKFIGDPVAAFAALKSGDVQAYPNYPAPENIAQFQRDPRFSVVVGTTEGETILAINNRNPPLNNLLVRRAISYAIDRKAVIDGAMYGYGPPIGSHYPPQDAGYIDLTGLYPHDVSKARALLDEAGYPNGFALRLDLPPPSYARRSGEIIAAELAKVGIRVTLENLEWAQWLDRVFTRHDFDLSIVSHVEPMDYDIYARPNYYFGYTSPKFNALLAALKRTNDRPAQLVLLGAIQRRLADDAVNGFLFELPRLGVWDAHLKGFDPKGPIIVYDVSQAYFDTSVSAGTHTSFAIPHWSVPLLLAVLAGLGLLLLLRAGPNFVLARAVSLSLTWLAATIVIFVLVQIVPGDPAVYMMGVHAEPEALAVLHKQMGLDAPAWQRYLHWLLAMLHGDFGRSYTYGVPVGTLIAGRIAVSLPLAVYALALSLVVAIPVGVAAAAGRGRAADSVVMSATQLGIAVPDFWLGILLVIVFSLTLRWFSAGGFPGWDAGPASAIKALTLPAIALAVPQAAILARVLRTALLETLGEPYLRTARAKGLTARQALWRHGLRNAFIPVLTIIGLQFPFLIAGAVIIENVFFLPGLGRLVSEAVAQRDLPVVESVMVLMVLAVVCVSFLVDLAYALVDPRLGRRA